MTKTKGIINRLLSWLDNCFNPTWERPLFYLLVLLNTIPVLALKYFPTFDGPAHLYNSHLLKELVFNSDAFINQYIVFNNEILPNWTSHFLLLVFNTFLPAFLSEKILLLCFIIFFPISFRYLLNTIEPGKAHFSYLIFPFTYNYLFFLGFFNFNLALIIMFITLAFWIRNDFNIISIRNIFTLFLLFVCLYFSHLFIFLATISMLGLIILNDAFFKIRPESIKDYFTSSSKALFALILSAAIPIIFAIRFLISRSSFSELIYIDTASLFENIFQMRAIIGLSNIKEPIFSISLFFTLIVMLIGVVWRRKKSWRIIRSDIWLLAAICFMLAYFIAPDESGTGGYYSVRLSLLSFIFFVLWLGLQYFNRWLRSVFLLLILTISFGLNALKWHNVYRRSPLVSEIEKTAEYIDEHSVVMPFNFSDDWYSGHFSNYLGANKAIIILDNYECSVDYFPLIWRKILMFTLLTTLKNHPRT